MTISCIKFTRNLVCADAYYYTDEFRSGEYNSYPYTIMESIMADIKRKA